MYWWIDDEQWVSDGAPAITELHGELANPESGQVYGWILSDDEERRVRAAMLQLRLERPVWDPFEG